MYFPIRRSLPARSEPENTFWTASTLPRIKRCPRIGYVKLPVDCAGGPSGGFWGCTRRRRGGSEVIGGLGARGRGQRHPGAAARVAADTRIASGRVKVLHALYGDTDNRQ